MKKSILLKLLYNRYSVYLLETAFLMAVDRKKCRYASNIIDNVVIMAGGGISLYQNL